jgi:hypothetical protein
MCGQREFFPVIDRFPPASKSFGYSQSPGQPNNTGGKSGIA